MCNRPCDYSKNPLDWWTGTYPVVRPHGQGSVTAPGKNGPMLAVTRVPKIMLGVNWDIEAKTLTGALSSPRVKVARR